MWSARRSWLAAAVLVLALAWPAAPGLPRERGESLRGQFLVAESKLTGPNFGESVVLMIRHDRNGAIGLIVNKPMGEMPLDLLRRGQGLPGGDRNKRMRVHFGGPVEPGVTHVLHDADFAADGTLVVGPRVHMSKLAAVLAALAEGRGPKRYLITIGYAGWGPGQLEGELARQDWRVVPADVGLLFSTDDREKWRRALEEFRLDL